MNVKLINMDCLEWLKQKEKESIDVIITSPPYNLKNRGGDYLIDSYKDNIPNKEYKEKQIEFLNECWRVLKPTGALFYNHKNRYEKNKVITPYEWVLESKLHINQVIIWNRKTTVDYNKSKFAPLDELIFWLYKDKTFKLKDGATSFTNIWNINRTNRTENMGHKATFPYQLIYRILNSLDTNYQDKTILDPYCGTGTTLQAAKAFNFKEGIGIDISQEWLDKSKIKIDIIKNFQEQIPKIKRKYNEKFITNGSSNEIKS